MRADRAPSLRALAAATLPAGALVVAAVAASLIGTTRTLRATVGELAGDARRDRDVAQVESSLHRYHRLGNAYLARGDPAIEAARDEALASVREHLDEARRRSGSAEQARELAALETDIGAYLERRRTLEARGAGVRVVARATRPMLDRALDDLARVQVRYERELDDSERRAETLATNAAMGGSAVLAIVLCSLLAFGLGLSRWVVRPLAGVLRAIDEFRSTGRPMHSPERGTEEIRRVTRALDEMSAALVEQRKRQLAFVGGVAHDLRNPLSGLRMSTTLARETAPALIETVEGARLVEGVERHTDRLARMIDDIVDGLRIEAGELSLALRELDLREPVRGVVDTYAYGSRDHVIELCVPDAPVMAVADPLRVEQVMGNLLSNAIKYSPREATIEVEVQVIDRHAVIAVRDRGVGIAPEELPHIFEPFRRVASGSAPGAGLGLSVLQRIVAAHGGGVEVESQPGVGSVFRVRLPLSPPARSDSGGQACHTASPRTPA